MGNKASVVKVKCNVSVASDGGPLDAITVSFKKKSCFGAKRREIVSFRFPSKNWRQLFPEDLLRNQSAEVAKVRLDKLMRKDRTTLVRVTCMAAGVAVFNTEMTLAKFLARLQHTQAGGEGVLSFSFRGRRLEGGGAVGYAFTAMFINGKWFGDGSAQHRLQPPQLPQTGNTSDDEKVSFDDELSPETEKAAKEWDEFVAKTYTDVWETEVSPVMEFAPEEQQKAKEWEEFVAKTYTDVWETEVSPVMEFSPEAQQKDEEWEQFVANYYGDVWDTDIPPSMEPPRQDVKDHKAFEDKRNPASGADEARGSLWNVVAGCGGFVVFVLLVYQAWVEYHKPW